MVALQLLLYYSIELERAAEIGSRVYTSMLENITSSLFFFDFFYS